MNRTVKVVSAITALVLVGSGCNSKLLRPPAIVFADSGEFAVKTSVKEQGRRFPSAFLAFLPSLVPLHPGDALNVSLRDTGEPHTVALGRLVDAAVRAVEELGPTATLKQIESLAAMKRVPAVLPSILRGDVPKLNASAAERCFLGDDRPAVSATGGAAACEESEQPEFNGTQSFLSSGLLEGGEPFRVKLSDEIAPGSYRFMCLVHRSAMTGTIEVRGKDVVRPSVAELRAQADAEELELGSTLEPSAREAATFAEENVGGPVAVGAGPVGLSRGFLMAFFGREVKAAVNAPVVWNFHRTHTVSFQPRREAKEGIVLEDADGVRLNPDAFKAAGSKVPSAELFSIPPTKKAFSIDGGTWSGEDFWSSGVIRATPPTTVSYTMRFSKAGTYAYSCLIHASMRGEVVVE